MKRTVLIEIEVAERFEVGETMTDEQAISRAMKQLGEVRAYVIVQREDGSECAFGYRRLPAPAEA